MSHKTRNHDTSVQNNSVIDTEVSRRLDDLNIKIVKELITRPDTSSTDIAEKFQIPLSTIQRRRARLEETIIKKNYTLDIRSLGWRTADLLITVEKGKAEQTAEVLLKNNKSNVVVTSLRIGHPKVDVMAEVFYRDSQELHKLTESVKAMPYVTFVEWAEIVKVVGSNLAGMLDKVLSYTETR